MCLLACSPVGEDRSEEARQASIPDVVAVSEDKRLNDFLEASFNAAWYRHFYLVDQFKGQVTNRLAFLQNNHKIDTLSDARA